MTERQLLESYRATVEELNIFGELLDEVEKILAQHKSWQQLEEEDEGLRLSQGHMRIAVGARRKLLDYMVGGFTEVVNRFEPEERLVLMCYYGMGMNQDSVAERLRMSKQRVGMILNGCLLKIDAREEAG